MKAPLQDRRLETAMLLERAQRALCESKELLEQGEVQLKRLELVRERRAEIAHEIDI